MHKKNYKLVIILSFYDLRSFHDRDRNCKQRVKGYFVIYLVHIVFPHLFAVAVVRMVLLKVFK